tara:strand:- start:5258 stop:6136 length:879 start_codon:yes stop_codon:yes gene_type:complete
LAFFCLREKDMPTEDAMELVLDTDFKSLLTTDGGGLSLLETVRLASTREPVDISTDKGRKQVISNANQVRRAKALIDKAGLAIVTPMKAAAKLIDAERKIIRDGCDKLADEIRQPVSAWEAEQEALAKAEEERMALFEEIDGCHVEAILMDQTRTAEKEATRLREENEKIQAENDRLAKVEQDRKDEVARLERDAEVRKEEAEKAAADAEEARVKAEQDKKDAVEAERKRSIEVELDHKMQAEKVAQNKEHRRQIHTEAYESLKRYSFTENEARAIVEAVRSGRIKHMRIIY